MSYKVKLQYFEGPFDLLVYLIENAKMSIYDIRISEITEQYLAYIAEMKAMDFAVAAEFMVLAATLIDIKSRMILPRNIGDDDDPTTILEDPRNELVARILEYKKYKDISEQLSARWDENSIIYDKPKEDISSYQNNPDEYLSLSLDRFVSAFELFLQKEKRMADVRAHYQRVEREKATIESRIKMIASKLKAAVSRGFKKISFRELIPNKKDKYDVIVSFASLLQMMKDRMLDAEQRRNYGEILVKPFRAVPIADDPDDGTINAGEPNSPESSRYVKIDEEDFDSADSADAEEKITASVDGLDAADNPDPLNSEENANINEEETANGNEQEK